MPLFGNYATDGPRGIKVVASPPDAFVDVVFIHGLTGNREKTWTHHFPNARIMTLGYDADVVHFWTIASSNQLDDHGKSLVYRYALLDQREEVGQRPIIFIAHSLGGLVCEEALNLSGSYLASWASTLAKYVSVFRGTNQEILKTLQPGSSDLQRAAEDFQYMLRRDEIKIEVFCFYEAVMMNGQVGKIVESESAIMAGYKICSINADHRNMTKFTGKTNAGYGQVRGILNRWIQGHGSSLTEAVVEEFPTMALYLTGPSLVTM
ncbi:hypothetical protein GQ43DRAFT_453291 [Delitschia confertaspora ATCC 74209]|uniref:DUF676 domain-containing protein n=1 Tax=Delitschia confertaspora ATCC 74209 TaxID=1513339 RepID=A0A9P4MTD5_9PLEO|nr:hypothetical protein GQ43DRAFT_453291 [Delitschia confertaspora ATCC 74209]